MPTANRQGTALRQPTSIRSDFNMNIVNRPVTNHGLGGIKGLNVGPGKYIAVLMGIKGQIFIRIFIIYLFFIGR